MNLPATTVELAVRVELCHASLQHLAGQAGVDLLHIKGIAFDPQWRRHVAGGSDADVLVRPSHVRRFLAAVEAHGWRRRSRFHTGSPFEHAQTYWHDHFAYADIHRFFPGLGKDEATFEALWAQRGHAELAGMACPVPALPAQALIWALNRARAEPLEPARPAAGPVLEDPIRPQVEALVPVLSAEVGWAAACGRLDSVRGHREHDLWHAVVHRTGRVPEWLARVRATPTLPGKARVLLRAPLVNVEHLANTRGHTPSAGEITVEFVDRLRRGALEAGAAGLRAARSRLGRGRS